MTGYRYSILEAIGSPDAKPKGLQDTMLPTNPDCQRKAPHKLTANLTVLGWKYSFGPS
jgi:hypothetical protein